VNYTEFLASLLDIMSGLTNDMVEKVFAVFDHDGNGVISAEELAAALSAGGPLGDVLADGTDLHTVLDELDVDRDGLINKAEFLDYLRSRAEGSQFDEHCADEPLKTELVMLPKKKTTELAMLPKKKTLSRLDTTGLAHESATSERLSDVFAEIGRSLDDAAAASQKNGYVPSVTYLSLCNRHASRLEEEHWLTTVDDLRLLMPSDFTSLGLPLKLMALLRMRCGLLQSPQGA